MYRNWRFIPYSIYSAAENMAIDEAILDAHLAGHLPPTLRLYGWKPPAVSIGYGQKLSERLEERIKKAGYDIVRRPTGGRAVLHAHELTYSFVGSADGAASDDGFLSDSVVAAYKQICEGLINAFRHLGVELSLGVSTSDYKNAHDCFLATTSADLHYQGKKMIGSAQLRRRHAVLQHGSILLDQPQDLMSSLLHERESDPGTQQSGQRHANFFEIVDKTVSLDQMSESIKLGFEEAFQKRFDEAPLNKVELESLHQTENKVLR